MNNRPIKFRAYDTKNKKWLTAVPSLEYLLDDEDECVSHNDIDPESAIYSYPHNLIGDTFDDRVIWQQFTGLKDSTGKEIYEGDIICWNGLMKHGCVHFDYGCFKLDGLPMTQFSQSEMQIVGNIFETPELLA